MEIDPIKNYFFFVLILYKIECKEYEDAKYERTYTNVGFNDKPILEKIDRCSFSNVPLVVGGEVANPGEFPHMVKNTSTNQYFSTTMATFPFQ